MSCRTCIECTGTQKVDGVEFVTEFEKYCGKYENVEDIERILSETSGPDVTVTCDIF